MTSLGAEWETNLLVYLPGGRLPAGVRDRVPFVKKGKLSMTLEAWYDVSPQTAADCLVNLEIQMGVFYSNKDNEFDLNGYLKTCQAWIKLWNAILKSRKIYINNQPYEVLIHVDKPQANTQYYKDCARKYKAAKGYTDQFFSKNVFGVPQLTIGIKLPRVISLFAFMSELYVNSGDEHNLLLLTMYQSYSTAGLYADSKGIKELSTIAFLILVAYYIQVSFVAQTFKKSYPKSYFTFKTRTNLYSIYEAIGSPRQAVRGLLIDIARENRSETLYTKIIRKFSQDFFSPATGYVVTNTEKKMLTTQMTIFSNDPIGAATKRVKAFVPYWYISLPQAKETSSTIGYDLGGKIPMDYGEWSIGSEKTVHLEFRGIPTAMNALAKGKYDAKKFKFLNGDSLCNVTGYAIKNILNKALKIDPNVIIRPEE